MFELFAMSLREYWNEVDESDSDVSHSIAELQDVLSEHFGREIRWDEPELDPDKQDEEISVDVIDDRQLSQSLNWMAIWMVWNWILKTLGTAMSLNASKTNWTARIRAAIPKNSPMFFRSATASNASAFPSIFPLLPRSMSTMTKTTKMKKKNATAITTTMKNAAAAMTKMRTASTFLPSPHSAANSI